MTMPNKRGWKQKRHTERGNRKRAKREAKRKERQSHKQTKPKSGRGRGSSRSLIPKVARQALQSNRRGTAGKQAYRKQKKG